MLNYTRRFFLLLAALLIVGCGDSREEYVFTGTSPNANTGSLTYNFTQPVAQAAYGAPAGTEAIRFELYTGDAGNGTRVVDETRAYASSITLTNVPASVRSTVLTFYGDGGIPLQVVTVASPVAVGQNRVVDFSGAVAEAVTFDALNVTPENLQLAVNQTASLSVQASFSNGQTVNLSGGNTSNSDFVTYTATPQGVVNVTGNGQVRGLAEGNATITVAVEVGNVTRTDSVAVSVNGTAPVGEFTSLQVTPSSSTLVVNETVTLTVSGSNSGNQTTNLTAGDYDVVSSNTSVATVNETSGALVVTGTGIGNATVTVTYTGDNAANDAALNATATITVIAGSDSNFDTFNTGTVNGQNGYTSPGNLDQAVVAVNRTGAAFDDFGDQALRISNAVAVNFDDALKTAPVAVPVGETTAPPTGTPRNNTFEASFDFTTASVNQTNNLVLNVGPSDSGEGRMSVVRLIDNVTGTDVVVFDYLKPGAGGPLFPTTTIASGLSRTEPHNIRWVIRTVDGTGSTTGNDVLQVYVDGVLAHTSTTWEDYYRFDPEATTANLASPRLFDRLLFQVRGTGVPANAGGGFLFNNVRVTSTNT